MAIDFAQDGVSAVFQTSDYKIDTLKHINVVKKRASVYRLHSEIGLRQKRIDFFYRRGYPPCPVFRQIVIPDRLFAFLLSFNLFAIDLFVIIDQRPEDDRQTLTRIRAKESRTLPAIGLARRW